MPWKIQWKFDIIGVGVFFEKTLIKKLQWKFDIIDVSVFFKIKLKRHI